MIGPASLAFLLHLLESAAWLLGRSTSVLFVMAAASLLWLLFVNSFGDDQ